MAEIKSYPELVDSIWTNVQGTPEERERVDFMFSEEQVARHQVFRGAGKAMLVFSGLPKSQYSYLILCIAQFI